MSHNVCRAYGPGYLETVNVQSFFFCTIFELSLWDISHFVTYFSGQHTWQVFSAILFFLKKRLTYWLSALDLSCGGQAPCFSERSPELTGSVVVAGDWNSRVHGLCGCGTRAQ